MASGIGGKSTLERLTYVGRACGRYRHYDLDELTDLIVNCVYSVVLLRMEMQARRRFAAGDRFRERLTTQIFGWAMYPGATRAANFFSTTRRTCCWQTNA